MPDLDFDLTTLNLVDLLLAAILLLGMLSGWGRGFVVATLGLLTLAASLVLALVGYHYPAAWLQAALPTLGLWNAPLGFLATYVLAHLLLGALASRMASALPPKVHAHAIDRTLGVLPGLIYGLINASIVALMLLTVPLPEALGRVADQSVLASRLAAPAAWLETQLAPIFHPVLSRTLQAQAVPAGSNTFTKLSYKVDNPQPRPDLEARMLEMVNAERRKAGLKSLAADPELAEVARAHSRDMFARGYFAHVSPEGQDLSDRMRQGKVRYWLAGENLALSPSLSSAHQGLMNSPGHRANILRAQYRRVGIGVGSQYIKRVLRVVDRMIPYSSSLDEFYIKAKLKIADEVTVPEGVRALLQADAPSTQSRFMLDLALRSMLCVIETIDHVPQHEIGNAFTELRLVWHLFREDLLCCQIH